MHRALPALMLLPLLAACGSAGPAPDVARPAAAATEGSAAEGAATERAAADRLPADPASLLAGLPAAAQDAGSVRYESVTVGGRQGEPAEVQGRLSGALDLVTGSGTGALELPVLAELAAEAAAGGEPSTGTGPDDLADLALSWTPTEVTAVVDGERHTAPRDAEDSAVIARVPGEPAGLITAVSAAGEVAVVGQEEVDGRTTTRLSGSISPAAAVAAGLGTQAQLSIAGLPSLPVEVWVDGDGRPARIRYVADVPSLQGGTYVMTTTYDYLGWGEPVDVTP